MHPDISEFSYGYALTETLVNGATSSLRAAPIFPSLIEEGKPGGGYDVQLPFSGFPLFLQFKLSHRMVRGTATEVQKGLLATPFYRMHLRPTKHSQQHPMLLTLEATGAAVFYAAPYFHTPNELNDAYTKRQVVQQSIFIRPSEVGPLPDADNHHIAFRKGSPEYFCSENPRLFRSERGNTSFIQELEIGLFKREPIYPTEQSTRSWAMRLEDIVRDRRGYIRWIDDEKLRALQDRDPLTHLAYLARTFFGCMVVIVAGPNEVENDKRL